MNSRQQSPNLKIVNTLNENVWRQFVEQHPQGNVFHTPEMFQVFAQAKNHQPQLWAAVDGQRVLALLLPVTVTVIGGALQRLTSRAVAYGGVLASPGKEGEMALDFLLQTYNHRAGKRHLFTELRNLADSTAVQGALRENGYLFEDHLNYLVDLKRSPDEVMQHIGKRTRKNIRRALRRKEIHIREADTPEDIALCYTLLHKTYTLAKVPLAHPSLFEAVFRELYPQGMVKFLLAQAGDTYLAASVELLYKDVIYGWYSGSDRAYSKYIPNDLLMWRILKWGAENGYRLYDFGGAGKPDEEYGVRDFKAKFGGKLVCFGRNTCVHSPLKFRASRLGYALLRRWL